MIPARILLTTVRFSIRPWTLTILVLFFLSDFFLASYQAQCQTRSAGSKLAILAEHFKNRVEYDSAEHYYRKLIELATASADLTDDLFSRLELSDVLILQRKYPEAKNELKSLNEEIHKRYDSDMELKARFFEIKGSYMLAKGMLDSARFFLENAINLRMAMHGNTDTLLHFAFNKMGNLYLKRSDFDSAYFYHKTALELSMKKIEKVNYLSASSYQNLGIASHMKGDFNQAEYYYSQSLLFKEQLFIKNDAALAKIYGNFGKLFSDLSKYDLALIYYDKSEQVLLSRYERNDVLFAYLYWNKGNVYTHKGDYNKATAFLSKALAILENNLGQYNEDVLKILSDLGFTFQKKGDNTLAIDHYMLASKGKDNAGIIKIYRNLGNIYSLMNQSDSADRYYRLAIEYSRDHFPGARYDLALCYQYYGEFLTKQTCNPSALKYFEEASVIFMQMFGHKNKDLAKVQLLESQYYFECHDYDAALKKTQDALVTLLPGFDLYDPENNPGVENIVLDLYLPNILSFKARVLYQRFKKHLSQEDLTLCLETVHLSLYVLEAIRKTYSEEESQLILNKEARNVIDLGVLITYDLYCNTGDKKYLAEAFRFSEKGQSIILLSALRGLQAKESIGIPRITIEYEDGLIRDLANYNNFLYQEKQKKQPDESKIKLWSDKIFSLNLLHDSLLTMYREQYPDYFRLKYDYSVISADSLQQWLPEDQVILEYHLTDSIIFGYLISREKAYIIKCGAKPDLLVKLDSLRQHFIRKDYFDAGRSQFVSLVGVSHSLYNILVHPFSADIRNKRLVIIPDGELGYLSFDLLVSEDISINTHAFSQLPWLIREHAISYSSSATVYFEQSKSLRGGKSPHLLAFAPSYDFYSEHRNSSITDSAVLNLSPITGTKDEINALSKLLKTRKRFDDEATEEYFKSHAGDYGILHLAMHTIIDNNNPLYSKLVFTPGSGTSNDDGFLNTYELFNLNLNGQLAVLSACNTGGGKLEHGEGIISLARGFFYAGIPSVLMTLWEIEDHSSADLMELFYQNLLEGFPTDIALQKAKKSYIESAGKLQSHPYFWAGFVSIGKTNPIEFSKAFSTFSLVWIAFAVVLTAVFLYLFINKRVFFYKKRY